MAENLCEYVIHNGKRELPNFSCIYNVKHSCLIVTCYYYQLKDLDLSDAAITFVDALYKIYIKMLRSLH